MSVAATAMTMDDQRPLMNTYDKLSSKQYEQSLSVVGGSGGGAPASGPASPTPSGSEEPHAYQHHNAHHHHHHSTHHQHQYHQQQQLMPPTALSATQQQQELEQQPSIIASAAEAVAAAAEHRQRLLEEEIESFKLEQTRLAQQCTDAQRREKILMRRLANKELEFQDYVSQIAEYKAAQAPSAVALRSALLDPAVNLLFEKLKKELKATKAKLEETQNELSAWKFTPDSNTGKRLMAKCRLLYQENEELGKMTSNGRLAKLETELAMQKSFSEEVKKSQSELDDFLQELDEDVEGMQSTILFLQQELKTTRDRIQLLEKENYQLRNRGPDAATVKDEVAESPCDLTVAELNGSSDNIKHECLDENVTYSISSTDDRNDNDAAISPAHQQLPAYNNSNSNNSNSNNTPPVVVPTSPAYAAGSSSSNSIEMRYQPSAAVLETIDENACLRTAGSPVDRFNGAEQAVTIIDGSTIPSNSLAAGAGLLRTAATRKRPFDAAGLEAAAVGVHHDIIDLGPAPTPTPVLMTAAPIVAVGSHVTAPRTLPPKKSKLRVTPMRRLSAQSNDIIEAESYTGNRGMGVLSGVGGVVVESVHHFDNVTVTSLASDETIIISGDSGSGSSSGISIMTATSLTMADEVVVVDGTAGNGAGMAQRIMTRRRSLRTQNGSDSNH